MGVSAKTKKQTQARRAEQSFVQGGINYYRPGNGDSVFPFRQGGRKQRVELLTPDSEIIFSRS